jgi:hypothetical protein
MKQQELQLTSLDSSVRLLRSGGNSTWKDCGETTWWSDSEDKQQNKGTVTFFKTEDYIKVPRDPLRKNKIKYDDSKNRRNLVLSGLREPLIITPMWNVVNVKNVPMWLVHKRGPIRLIKSDEHWILHQQVNTWIIDNMDEECSIADIWDWPELRCRCRIRYCSCAC